MLINWHETIEPEDLAVLGTVFDEVWSSVSGGLRHADVDRRAAARTQLANILLQLVQGRRLGPDEMKRRAIQTFTGGTEPAFAGIRRAAPVNLSDGP
jgi:hypothetical protein